ncbi:sulfotransferase domain-containing protein [Thiohalocapsa marina]|uniref:Sulfotransferase domain-containing protein n=1 Tax=Thiohalocapsa marina TaxID=424902 RepID=A0A5M8FUA1_9GAMM|nr:sulfotransferase domain-containing protein [Thiohalocapsa marina]KAA6187401.1 sulfotransferase domain-containing protein [Thiohalocapsa marina]
MPNQLVWLASYPKSGNTWVRAFLTAYQNGPGSALDINRLDVGLHAASRRLFDRVIGFPASDLIPAEIDRLRPEVYRSLNREATRPVFMKVHDAWRHADSGEPVFPPDATRLAVYIVRNPLAVAPSLASHLGCSIDQAIEHMASDAYRLAGTDRKLHRQLPQPVGAWSAHVDSWLGQTAFPVLLLRYEDLCAEPRREFFRLIDALNLSLDERALDWALEQTRFDRLQASEASTGFSERLINAPRFFRQGRSDAWREELSPEQVARILRRHQACMRRFGYEKNALVD